MGMKTTRSGVGHEVFLLVSQLGLMNFMLFNRNCYRLLFRATVQQ